MPAHVILDALAEVAAGLPVGKASIVGRGAICGLRFADAAWAERVRRDLFRAGIIAKTAGSGHVLKFLPHW